MTRSLRLLLPAATAALVAVVTGCGSSKIMHDTTRTLPSHDARTPGNQAVSVSPGSIGDSYLKSDGDDDLDDRGAHGDITQNDDIPFLAKYGRPPRHPDAEAITALVKRYYLASQAGNGAIACLLLDSRLVDGLTRVGSRTTACAKTITPLLQAQHSHLIADDVAHMTVIGIRVRGDLGLVVLGFRTQPISAIAIAREKGAWRVDALFDSIMT